MRAERPSGRDVLIEAVSGQRGFVLLSALMVTGHQAGEALVPYIIGVVLDRAVSGGVDDLIRWLALLSAVYVGLSFSYRFGERTGERAAEQAGHDLRLRVTRRVLEHRGGAENGRLPGALVNIATADARRVGVVNVALPSAVAAVAAVLAAAALLLSISLPLGLLVLLGTPPMLWLAHLLGKPLERRSDTEQDRAAHASGIAADLVAGLRVLKGLGGETAAVRRYHRTSQDALTATVRAARAEAAYNGVMLTLNGVFLALIALVGGRLAADGEITIGQLISAVGLAQFLVGPLTTFSWVNADLAQGRASAARIASVLAAPGAVRAGTAAMPDPVRGRIRVRGLSGAPLREVDLEIGPGELVGIVATDAAEAAALLSYLGRAADPDAGTVELDGVALSELDPGELRAAILVAGHDADLFDGTLRANIVPADRTNIAPADRVGITPADRTAPALADRTEIGPALEAAAADEVVRTLADGLDTVLDERGRSLSGGQRQRVALARALAADPPVLVIHDPTTAVDAVTEARVADGIKALRDRRTTIMVTTSPALLTVTDRVIVMHEGKVAMTGRHADLIHDHRLYRTTVLA